MMMMVMMVMGMMMMMIGDDETYPSWNIGYPGWYSQSSLLLASSTNVCV